MSQVELVDHPIPADAVSESLAAPLSAFRKGDQGVIGRVGGHQEDAAAVADAELERRLLELGFVEGARIEVLHEGLFGRDPIAVKLDDMRVALRRREAAQVFVHRTGRRA
jgi:ferrous iron transport protein A